MRELTYREWIARSIARALLADAGEAGTTEPHALLARARAALHGPAPWLPALVDSLASMTPSVWQHTELVLLTDRIAAQPAFAASFADGNVPRVRRLILRPPAMLPRPFGLDVCNLPVLPTTGDLAAWAGIDVQRLMWLANEALRYRAADRHRPGAHAASHYRCLLQPKRLGGLRLIEAPKADLKALQRHLLDDLLQQVPVHEAAHGFVPGRSVLTHAAAHVGQAVVVRFDLRDFFPSIRASRVHALWRTLGYPDGIARTLTSLCTTRTPAAVLERLLDDGGVDWLGAKRLAAAHLPQGAPTSPVLANLCSFGLDLRLDGLARAFGATYTRYADDLVFSGPEAIKHRSAELQNWTAGIAADEGFVLHPRKTRCMPRHRQQRITGVVVNHSLNTPRQDFERLKACLHQCVLRGPASQNKDGIEDFRAHLLGRIAWTRQLNPARAARLARLFDRIEWAEPRLLATPAE